MTVPATRRIACGHPQHSSEPLALPDFVVEGPRLNGDSRVLLPSGHGSAAKPVPAQDSIPDLRDASTERRVKLSPLAQRPPAVAVTCPARRSASAAALSLRRRWRVPSSSQDRRMPERPAVASATRCNRPDRPGRPGFAISSNALERCHQSQPAETSPKHARAAGGVRRRAPAQL